MNALLLYSVTAGERVHYLWSLMCVSFGCVGWWYSTCPTSVLCECFSVLDYTLAWLHHEYFCPLNHHFIFLRACIPPILSLPSAVKKMLSTHNHQDCCQIPCQLQRSIKKKKGWRMCNHKYWFQRIRSATDSPKKMLLKFTIHTVKDTVL